MPLRWLMLLIGASGKNCGYNMGVAEGHLARGEVEALLWSSVKTEEDPG